MSRRGNCHVPGGAVTYAKTTVVVRSVKVGFDNLLGTVLHLGFYGINPIAVVKGMWAKTIEHGGISYAGEIN